MLINLGIALAFLLKLISVQSSELNVGSIFAQHQQQRSWTDRELLTLRARQVLQDILPPETTPNKIDSKYIRDFLQYVNTAIQQIKSTRDEDIEGATTDAIADILGGYLRTELLPNARYAYYAGSVTNDDVRQLYDLYEEAKTYLNTVGRGWRSPKNIDKRYSFIVDKVDIDARRKNACSELITLKDYDECINIPMPKLDEEDVPSSIALPFKKNSLMGLFSNRSSQELVRFYRTAAECILSESPFTCRREAISRFNAGICRFVRKEVSPHLGDERWYVGFGGVLRVAAAVQDFCDSPKSLQLESPADIETETSRHKDEIDHHYNYFLLVQAVTAIAVSLWVFVSIVNFCMNKRKQTHNGLHRAPSRKPSETIQNASARRSEHRHTPRGIKSQDSRHSVPMRTESVYDMNEEIMKQMPVPNCPDVIEVDVHKAPVAEMRSSSGDSYGKTSLPRSSDRSPPRIDTQIAQLKVKKNNSEPAVPRLPREGQAQPITPLLAKSRSERRRASYKAYKCINRNDDPSELVPVYSTSRPAPPVAARSSPARNLTLATDKKQRQVWEGREWGAEVNRTSLICEPQPLKVESMSSSVYTSSTGSSSQEARRGIARSTVARIAKDLARAKRFATRRRNNTKEEKVLTPGPDSRRAK